MKKSSFFKKFRQKFTKKQIIICLVIASVLSISLLSSGLISADEWDGWDDEKRDQAWTALSVTTWEDIQGLSMTEDGSYAYFSDNQWFSNFQDIYSPIVTEILSDSSVQQGIYPSREYVPLMLSIMKVIQDSGRTLFGEEKLLNPNFYKWTIYEDPSTQKDSILFIYNKLIACETAYYQKYDYASIYSVDSRLKAIVQSVFYGEGFLRAYANYTKDDAKSYFEEHYPNHPYPCADFANEVMDHYHAFPAVGA